MNELKYFKMHADVADPIYATDGAAAFDVHVHLTSDTQIRQYNPHNREMVIPVKNSSTGLYAQLMPGFRSLIPTGLKFDIPEGYYMEVVIRSSSALKLGLALANQTGVIDEDYVDELFLMMYCMGDTPIQVRSGERLAQVILKKKETAVLVQIDEAPEKKGNRTGGLGSTGTSEVTTLEKNIKRGPGRPPKKEI